MGDREDCRIFHYDGAFQCNTHARLWGAVTSPTEPCEGWREADIVSIGGTIVLPEEPTRE